MRYASLSICICSSDPLSSPGNNISEHFLHAQSFWGTAGTIRHQKIRGLKNRAIKQLGYLNNYLNFCAGKGNSNICYCNVCNVITLSLSFFVMYVQSDFFVEFGNFGYAYWDSWNVQLQF